MTNFKLQLYNITIYRKERDKIRNWVLRNPELMQEIVEVAFDLNNESHTKACWIIELLAMSKIELLQPYLDLYCDSISKFKNESSVRVMAKTSLLLIKESSSEKPKFHLSKNQIDKLTECCMDWLISDKKVATKAYCIEALFVLGKYQDWIYPELQQVLADGYSLHSNGYKAAARKALRKIQTLDH